MKINIPSTAEDGFQIAPMIDCVFQLMIFFMSASHMHTQLDMPAVDIPVASYSHVAEGLPADRRFVSIQTDGTILIGGQEATLDQVKEVVRKQLRQIPDLKVVVRADKKLKHNTVREVMQACAEGGASEVIFSTFESAQ